MTYWINPQLGVISLYESMTEEGVIIVDVRDLSDVEKDVEKIKREIRLIANLLCAGERVAVRCVAGINRSCGIALGVMCYMGSPIDDTWEHHYKTLRSRVGRCMITQQFERVVKRAVKELVGWKL